MTETELEYRRLRSRVWHHAQRNPDRPHELSETTIEERYHAAAMLARQGDPLTPLMLSYIVWPKDFPATTRR